MHIFPADTRGFCGFSHTILMRFGYVHRRVRKSRRADAGGGHALALIASAGGVRERLLLESPDGQSWIISPPDEPASLVNHLPLMAAAALITAEEDSWGLDVPGDVELVAVHLERQIESLRRSAQAVLALVDVATDPPPVTRA